MGRKVVKHIDRVGIDLPKIEVKFEHLTVEADINTGSRALPSFINFHIDIFEMFLSLIRLLPNTKKHITILDDVSGLVKPSRMTLLLGPPSSGKTTLLLALAGKLDKELKSSGKVTYNGHELHEFVPERTSAYISQDDVHIGEMTVRETLAFSARCQGVGSRYGLIIFIPSQVPTSSLILKYLDIFNNCYTAEMLAELSRREKDANIKPDPDVDVFMKSAASKGQEANVVTDYTLKMLGLDVVQIPWNCCYFSSPPAPETYDLFDDIILLIDGKIVYQGPRDNVLEFFEFMGFKCPERKGVADFLQEVTSRNDQQQYWMRRNEHYRFVSAKEFADSFQSFHIGKRLREDLATPYDKSRSHPAALSTEKYGLNKKDLLKACIDREILLMKRNSFVYYFKLSQISMTIAKLPVFYKQRDFLFYPSWAYALPTWIVNIPVSFIECALWMILTYYVIGFDPNITRFFRQYFLFLIINQMSAALFRFIGAMGRNMIVANTFGSFSLLIMFALGGFVLARDDVKKWWLWGYWTSPMMYAMNGIVVNEFLSDSWNKASHPINDTTLRKSIISSRGFFTDAYWYWIGVVASEMREQGTNKARLMLLKGVSGAFRPGVLTALMGVSGAGKTTLMDVLAGRKTGGYIEGDIRISGYPKKQETFARISGYCEQNDIHSPHVTVYESLLYSAWLRLSTNDEGTRKMFVDEVMELVELNPLRDALVGLPGVNGLSTEQRKRLTIAVELVANPSIIFMDEPTSGLDARAAAIVMRTVRNTVDTGRTVVCTIHQPSIDIFEAFDELFLLKRGGQENDWLPYVSDIQ
ncbi:pleiotropic drug resistance protein 1-like protein [Tanacetum coccineum]